MNRGPRLLVIGLLVIFLGGWLLGLVTGIGTPWGEVIAAFAFGTVAGVRELRAHRH